MDDRAESYRQLAQEAERKAEATTDVVAKRAYWEIADKYNELAHLIERQSR